MNKYHLVIFLLLITTAISAQSSPPKRYYEKVDVGGYKLSIQCTGEGSPTVILESGFGDDSGTWGKVTPEVNDITRVCTYSRAGLGLSDPIPTESRTSQDVVNDLHALLTNANIEGPYILVGHSIGGFHIRLYADQYPDEVVGMVLEDSSHPDQFEKLLAVLPPETAGEAQDLKEIRSFLNSLDATDNPEKFNFKVSIVQVKETKPLGNLPLVVLTQSPTCKDNATLPSEVATEVIQVWQDSQVELANLSTNSIHIVAMTACHFIHLDEPQLVIDTILKVLEEVRQ